MLLSKVQYINRRLGSTSLAFVEGQVVWSGRKSGNIDTMEREYCIFFLIKRERCAKEPNIFCTYRRKERRRRLTYCENKRIEIPWFSLSVIYAQVVKLVDTLDLGSSASRHVGSSPILGIAFLLKIFLFRYLVYLFG